MAQISTVLIPCWVVQMNNTVFSTDTGIIGRQEDIDCRNVLVDKVLYWATPVKDFGFFEGAALQYRLMLPPNEAQPTYDSFLVQRIRDKISGYTWWIYVTADTDQFISSCETCCGEDVVAMPGLDGFDIIITPCQEICAQNSDGDYQGVFGLPTLNEGEEYLPVGSFDNEALTEAPDTYATISDLLVFLSVNWNPIGGSSPGFSVTWEVSSDELTLIAVFSDPDIAGHSLCVTVISSPPL